MPKILLNILLIFGAVKKKGTSISIYLWCNMVYFGLEALTMIAAAITYFVTDYVSWEPLTTFLVYYIVQIYFWLCVNSFYAELKLESQFSLRQQMRGATLTNINFSTTTSGASSSSSRSNRQQSFPLRLLRAS
ncbi:uncharacterized protein LOC134835426 [Culicoides brevitarsis]|uniref:uncharacterized protein LOC134835426 n=1 Tax=Culicoides brevitarsis TaxID=469753 RepID=UPI00307B95E8